MIRRRWTTPLLVLGLTAMSVGASAWAFAPTKVETITSARAEAAPANFWARGRVDQGNMIQGVLDYRSDILKH